MLCSYSTSKRGVPSPRLIPISNIAQNGQTCEAIARTRKLRDIVNLIQMTRLLSDTVPRHRLKLCICGFGGAGKSQLLRSLQSKQSPFLTAKDNPRNLQERTPGVSAKDVTIGGCNFNALDFGARAAISSIQYPATRSLISPLSPRRWAARVLPHASPTN